MIEVGAALRRMRGSRFGVLGLLKRTDQPLWLVRSFYEAGREPLGSNRRSSRVQWELATIAEVLLMSRRVGR